MAETMRGMRLGAQSMESENGVEFSARQLVEFECVNSHRFEMVFAQGAELPASWDCKRCSAVAVRLQDGVPVDLGGSAEDGPRTHYDMVLERRSREELEELLQEMLDEMRSKRASGRLSA